MLRCIVAGLALSACHVDGRLLEELAVAAFTPDVRTP